MFSDLSKSGGLSRLFGRGKKEEEKPGEKEEKSTPPVPSKPPSNPSRDKKEEKKEEKKKDEKKKDKKEDKKQEKLESKDKPLQEPRHWSLFGRGKKDDEKKEKEIAAAPVSPKLLPVQKAAPPPQKGPPPQAIPQPPVAGRPAPPQKQETTQAKPEPHAESKRWGLFGRGKKEVEKEAKKELKPAPPSSFKGTTPKPGPLPQAAQPPQKLQPGPNVDGPLSKEPPSSGGSPPIQKVAPPQRQETIQVPKPMPDDKHKKSGSGKPVSLEPALSEADEEAALAQRFKFLKNVKIRYPFTGTQIPPSWKVLERYPVNSPFAYAVIAQSPLLSRRYYLDEVPLTKTEAAIYSYLLDALEAELTVPREQVNPRQYFADQARKILLKYSIRVPAASWSKIIYFAERDLVGFGVLDGIMRDPNIEDISIDALAKPLFVYHKGYESLETNLTVSDEEQMDNLITRLSHMAGKHVSTAYPIVQGTLPGRHRLIATFRREVSPQGSTATIRKFREDPLTIIDMLNLNLMDYRIAAYTWFLMQNRATAVVVGSTGAGKTTLLNALLTLTRLTTKMVTIEEVQEVNIPHLNWTSLVSRESYATTDEKAGEVGLFDLVKAAMRMRPDILCVGEVRGEEAYVLFQAISTGHGGICTLHADDTSSAIQRLVSAPMNVPPAFLPFLDLSFVVRRIAVPAPGGGFRAIRRVVAVDEVVASEEVSRAFRWDPRTDTFKASYDKSPKLERVSRDNGTPMEDILKEIDRRALVLRWIQQKGIRNFKELSPILELYVSRPEEVFKTASTELEAKGIAVAEIMGGFRAGE